MGRLTRLLQPLEQGAVAAPQQDVEPQQQGTVHGAA